MLENNKFIKHDVAFSEYFTHEWAYKLLKNLAASKETRIKIMVPKIYHYDQTQKILTMQKISGDNLSNIYGENIEDVPPKILPIIRQFIALLSIYGIDYPDITGYNFMLDKSENLWAIDFGHCISRDNSDTPNKFIQEFINGKVSWNPEYK